jgi:phosphoribosylglycinamide formyltransferase-1
VTLRAAVFASGRGSNFQVLAEHASRGSDRDPPRWEVGLLVSDRSDAFALERARDLGVRGSVLPPSEDPESYAARLESLLDEEAIDIILLAGYLRLIPEGVVRRYAGRMLNLHPALLPSFGGKGMYGRRVHEAVLESGARVSGVTVQYVDAEYDRGRILAQWPVPVLTGDTPETLAARIHEVEHWLYPLTVDHLAEGLARGGDPIPIPGPEGRHFKLTTDFER